MDIISLAGRLPNITEGAQIWITKFEKKYCWTQTGTGRYKKPTHMHVIEKQSMDCKKKVVFPKKMILHSWKERCY